MKKIAKIAVGITLAATVAATAGVLAGCGDKGTTVESGAFALTHGANRFIGYSLVTLDKEGKITDVVLTEVDLPTQLNLGTSEEPKYYAEVTYGNVTMTYNAEDNTYFVGEQNITTYFQSEANCKAYYEAAINGKIKASETVGGKKVTLTKKVLSKEENGYWTYNKKPDGTWDNHGTIDGPEAYSRWKWNRDATVAYVKANGVDGLLTLTKPGKEDPTNGKDHDGADVKMWQDSNGIVTGATWSDLGSKPAANTYTSYAQLIVNAYNVAVAKLAK